MALTAPTLWPDDLHFDSFGGAEAMTHYIPGGYHPIIIGDTIAPSPGENGSSQYRIMHKLGYGSYSTVWLAQKLEKNGTQTKWVAVKVTTAQKDDGKTREAAMLKTIPTNLHLGNIGPAFPELDDQDPYDVMMKLDPYDMTVVLPISAAHQTSALPAYVTGPT